MKVSKVDASLEHSDTCILMHGTDMDSEMLERKDSTESGTSRTVKYAIFMIFNGVNWHKIQL